MLKVSSPVQSVHLVLLSGNKIYKTNNTTPESYEIQHAMRMMVDAGCKVMIIEASSLWLKMAQN